MSNLRYNICKLSEHDSFYTLRLTCGCGCGNYLLVEVDKKYDLHSVTFYTDASLLMHGDTFIKSLLFRLKLCYKILTGKHVELSTDLVINNKEALKDFLVSLTEAYNYINK